MTTAKKRRGMLTALGLFALLVGVLELYGRIHVPTRVRGLTELLFTSSPYPAFSWRFRIDVAYFRVRIDDGPDFRVRRPRFAIKEPIPTGVHTITVCAVNRAGKVSEPSSERFTVYDPAWFASSRLPIIVIETDGKIIPPKRQGVANERIPVRMRVIREPDDRLNRPDSTAFDYDGLAGVKVRGQSSASCPKSSYSVELWTEPGQSHDVPLLGLPPESDWVLYGPYLDKSLIRNWLAYALSNRIGRYAPRTRFVELFVVEDEAKQTGAQHYRGLYLLTEKIKRGRNRVDVTAQREGKVEATDADADVAMSGGYIVELSATDRLDRNDHRFTNRTGRPICIKYPSDTRITEAQTTWIAAYYRAFETALASASFADERQGYRRYIDTESFINLILLNDLMSNRDFFRASTYLHKDRSGPLVLGPVWDFNIAMGNTTREFGGSVEGWLFYRRYIAGRLFEDPWFTAQYRARWRELRSGALADTALAALVTEGVERLGPAAGRNFLRWPILGVYVWPNPEPLSQTYEDEIERLGHWLIERAHWLDAHMHEL